MVAPAPDTLLVTFNTQGSGLESMPRGSRRSAGCGWTGASGRRRSGPRRFVAFGHARIARRKIGDRFAEGRRGWRCRGCWHGPGGIGQAALRQRRGRSADMIRLAPNE
jgi:hypothetical protein